MSLATSSRGGAVHWNGPPMGLGSCAGDDCVRAWEGIRRFHVQQRGWRDIAYNHGVCPGCGRRLEGRGWGVRSAANGTDAGNSEWHAWIVLQGQGEKPTDAAKRTLLDLNREHYRRYGRSTLTTHHDVRNGTTECPGPDWRRWVAAGAPLAILTPAPASEEDDVIVNIEGGKTAYHVVGATLHPIPSPEVAEVIGGPSWRDKVQTITEAQARRFRIITPDDLYAAARLRLGAESVGSSPLGVGRWAPLAVRHLDAEGVDLESYIDVQE